MTPELPTPEELRARLRAPEAPESPARPDDRRIWWEDHVPAAYAESRLLKFEPQYADPVKRWIDDGFRRNLFIYGATGVGKSTLLWATVHDLVAHDHRPAVYNSVKMFKSMQVDAEEPVSVDHYANVKILGWDDIGTEQPTKWKLEQMYYIVNERWEKGLPTIVTSNLSPTALLEARDERVGSRLLGNAVLINLKGRDRRLGG